MSLKRAGALAFAVFALTAFRPEPIAAQASIRVRVESGPHARFETPIRCEIPDGIGESLGCPSVYSASGTVMPAQWETPEKRAIVFVLRERLGPKETHIYRIADGPCTADVSVSDEEGKHLVCRVGEDEVLRYNYGVMEPPEGYGELYARSGYIHPIRAPSGRIVSNDFPPQHKHHHGIWFPWTATEFQGRKVDFWNSGKGEGRIECTGVQGYTSGHVYGRFATGQRFLDLKAPSGPIEVLREQWDVRVYSQSKYNLIDFESVQECSTEDSLKLLQNRYGGFGFRGSHEWEGEHVEFLTSEGKTRKDGHATTARWCAVYGKVDGSTCGVTFFCHPENFRAPQNMRIHPNEPFFNWAPCQAGDFAIEPGKPYRSRYRFVVYEGAPDVGEMERLWRDYVDPPKVTVLR